MSKATTFILLLILIAAGGLILFGKKDVQAPTENNIEITTPENTAPESDTATIEYMDTGFTPPSLEVMAGTTVTFINRSTADMWVASNPHPTHTTLPEFDELKSVGNGGSYAYTFTTPGIWSYHNHARARDTGTIIVK